MAEQQTPTFKLVLVGDGGTGKVRLHPWHRLFLVANEGCPAKMDADMMSPLRPATLPCSSFGRIARYSASLLLM